ncbi:uncharacterized protein IL334_002058 [Kwoniella shivajii]|uniref:BRCT domain-containing protein n=1 Tax=Kwoniella shivajii TaxID=564305 RepID=A0ABZ1CTX3_9TREE|nr:hypothetical protein IL334_002058 [Kwoniella shivajii]
MDDFSSYDVIDRPDYYEVFVTFEEGEEMKVYTMKEAVEKKQAGPATNAKKNTASISTATATGRSKNVSSSTPTSKTQAIGSVNKPRQTAKKQTKAQRDIWEMPLSSSHSDDNVEPTIVGSTMYLVMREEDQTYHEHTIVVKGLCVSFENARKMALNILGGEDLMDENETYWQQYTVIDRQQKYEVTAVDQEGWKRKIWVQERIVDG